MWLPHNSHNTTPPSHTPKLQPWVLTRTKSPCIVIYLSCHFSAKNVGLEIALAHPWISRISRISVWGFDKKNVALANDNKCKFSLGGSSKYLSYHLPKWHNMKKLCACLCVCVSRWNWLFFSNPKLPSKRCSFFGFFLYFFEPTSNCSKAIAKLNALLYVSWSFDGGARGIRNALLDLSTSGQSLNEGAVV